ncbi:hypothetical protein GWK47_009482 [Chionoecetes opilio]|uniref:Uncharacterized protein n=1 Tax=Chionoecetes opilio TaxID=41210 RepID=A0A8J4Y5A9_CHIOP|nr:hypothetical protein GWK47_009482 [Chionoecetes opilio]
MWLPECQSVVHNVLCLSRWNLLQHKCFVTCDTKISILGYFNVHHSFGYHLLSLTQPGEQAYNFSILQDLEQGVQHPTPNGNSKQQTTAARSPHGWSYSCSLGLVWVWDSRGFHSFYRGRMKISRRLKIPSGAACRLRVCGCLPARPAPRSAR